MSRSDAAVLKRRSRAGDAQAKLPPRLRRTLERLLAGDSEKEAARALGISHHTVHHYVKQIYRRLGVNSRGELMAKWVKS